MNEDHTMIRKLLATTALASVIATGAFAQETTNPATTSPSAAPTDSMAPAETGSPAMATSSAMQGEYLQTLGTDEYLASDLTGQTVYPSEAPDAEAAGEIDDFLLGSDGKIVAAVIDTAGLDESKVVAVPIEKLTWAMGENNELRGILRATRDELVAAPAFTETTAADAARNGISAPAAGGTTTAAAPTTTTAPAASTDIAAAPSSGTTPQMSSDQMAKSDYAATVGADQYLTQSLIGSGVYSGPAADAEQIGSINDLVVSKAGDVVAGVVGVGGFLGIGEKNVGVPFAELQMTKEDGTEPRILLAATKDQLTAAPTFEEEADEIAASDTATGTSPMANPGSTDQTAATAATTGAATGAAMGTSAATGSTSDTTASTGGASDRSAMTPVTGPELTADNLEGTTVYGPNDASIGEVGDIALNQNGQVDAIILDVGDRKSVV